jgi:hypothetical protein
MVATIRSKYAAALGVKSSRQPSEANLFDATGISCVISLSSARKESAMLPGMMLHPEDDGCETKTMADLRFISSGATERTGLTLP